MVQISKESSHGIWVLFVTLDLLGIYWIIISLYEAQEVCSTQ